MAPLSPLSISVRTRADVERARWEARDLARTLGFMADDVERVGLATAELGTNLVRHASGGTLVLSAIDEAGVQVQSLDTGPGIQDVARALEDGFSTSGGLGGGLPAIGRLMDELTIDSSRDGTRVVTRKWRSPR